ncbi:MAG TPA: glycoside hydrolase family 31 protein [Cellulomonas sp.]
MSTVQVRQLPQGVELRVGHEVVRLDAWGTSSVRVRAGQHAVALDTVGALAATAPLTAVDVELLPGSRGARLVVGELTVTAWLDDAEGIEALLLGFIRTADGAELLTERREHFWWPAARVYQGHRDGSYAIRQSFAAYDDERLYGLGQHTHGRLDHKGLVLDLVQRNGEVSIPFLLSSRGYGFLWNNPALGRVELAGNGTRWTADASRQIDYWVSASTDPAQVLRQYADAVGHAPRLPDWATGFWQCKLRYLDQEEVLGVAREYRRRGLPLSVVVTDFLHWPAMGDFRFDPQEYPDPRRLVEELRDLGVELMVSVWPTVSPLSENFAEMRDAGYLVATDRGVEFHETFFDKKMTAPLPVAFYDATNPDARDYVWERIRRNYLDLGVRAFWLDACEPELDPGHADNLMLHAGPGAQVANVYPREHARAFFEGTRAAGQDEAMLLCRSAWAGQAALGAAVWSGDIPPTWVSLAEQVRAGMSISLAGVPWWTTDIGGFHGGDPADPRYRELFVRWFEFGMLCPLARLHGNREPRQGPGWTSTGGPNEVWSYGEEAYPILADQLRFREALRPYLGRVMAIAADEGVPPMRPLFVDFPDDPAAWQVDDQYLLGPDLLVAPVVVEGARSRAVYLPAGTRWREMRTGTKHEGGTTLDADAPLEAIPVFVRDGADIGV